MNLLGMLGSLWQVVVFGLLIGAGLPAVFALGLRALSPAPATGPQGSATGNASSTATRIVAGRLLAGVCFAIVVGAVALGIWVIAAGGH